MVKEVRIEDVFGKKMVRYGMREWEKEMMQLL